MRARSSVGLRSRRRTTRDARASGAARQHSRSRPASAPEGQHGASPTAPPLTLNLTLTLTQVAAGIHSRRPKERVQLPTDLIRELATQQPLLGAKLAAQLRTQHSLT